MAGRIKNQEITRRTVTAQRTSEAPQLRVQADLDSSRGFSAIGAAASDVFGKLGQVANRKVQERTVKKFAEDTTQGQKDRAVESLNGTAVQEQQTLAEKTDGYRRGYYLTEGANRIHAAKLEIAKEVAGLRPGEDMNPIVQKHMAAILEAPEFQDPAILKELQPALQQMQQGVAEFRQKTELAEIFDSQAENLRQMARDGVKDGSLRTAAGVANFRAALNTEPFAFLDDNDADDILAGAYADMVETGEIDPAEAEAALKTPLPGDSASLWDREGWSEKFETAVAAGSVVRNRQFEEQQAQVLSGMEYKLQGRAQKGQLSIGEINALADQVGMQGKDRLTFVRRWIDQNDAGLKHMETEANRAKQHKETIAAITANNAMGLTDAKLNKSAEVEWAAAVTSGDPKQRAAVIDRYTRAGIVIPQLKDMLGRTTERNLTANYNLYAELAKIDRVAADRYLSEENATLFAMHHDNITQFGMTPEESIQALPTGATKGKRVEVARETSSAAVRYFKDHPTMADGSPRTRAVQSQIEQQAIRLGLRNPNATFEDNLKAAERRVQGGLIQVNGRWVPRGGARPTAAPAIDAYVREGADDLVKQGVIPAELRDGVYAAPLPDNPNRFGILLPNGFPVSNPKTGKPLTFDPMEVAAVRADFDSQRREAEVRASMARGRTAPTVGMGRRGPALTTQSAIEDATTNLKPTTVEGTPFPAFMDFLQDHRTKKKQGN